MLGAGFCSYSTGSAFQRRMKALTVVEHLDGLEDGLTCLGAGGPGVTVDSLGVEGREPTLADGVVPALGRLREALVMELSWRSLVKSSELY